MTALEGFNDVTVVRAGATFTVRRATDVNGRSVLIKTTASTLANASTRARLRAEYEVGHELRHPNIVETLELVETGPTPLLLLADRGLESLRDVMERQPLSLEQVLWLAEAIAAGLAELHRRDIVHRDIKPDNIAVDLEQRQAEIIDLGIATRVPRQQTAIAPPSTLMGTLAYISPEQTGRTSRAVDHRSDLYSLGVTLYELLAGAPPFAAEQPLELVHQHLAVAPPLLTTVVSDLPPIVAQLVARLLAKDPDDRYRSAVGVLQDLARIRAQPAEGKNLDGLSLDGVHLSTRFQLPDRLFGRDDELAELERAFTAAADGESSVLLVGGFSGVGKTSLIEELRASVNLRRGYQAVGKIDQLDRGAAHQAVLGALRDLVRRLLTEDERRIEELRAELLDALGSGAATLVEAVPELGVLLGPLPPAPQLEASSERNLFNQLISDFLSTVATTDHPVVIVLDDLQWADTTTIDFLERTYRHLDGAALLVVGAYRDNEVDDSHPLSLLRRRLAETGTEVPSIRLGPLDDDAMAALVATSLGRTVSEAEDLIEVCVARTGSNPFFVRLFLQSLFEDDLLWLDQDERAWSWDLERIKSRAVTDNVAELATSKLDRLDDDARSAVAAMSIMGNEGDAELLTEVGVSEPVAILETLATLGLVNLTADAESSRWAFAHDRIQEGASQLLGPDDALEWYQRIGDALQRRLDRGGETSIFSVLRHKNLVAIQAGVQDEPLAEANLTGGQAAMRATSYEAAQTYFSTGIDLLGADQWRTNPGTAFALHLGSADAARLATDFETMDRRLGVIAAEESDPLRRVEAAQLKILHFSHEGKNQDAVEVAREQLGELGWSLPRSPGLPQVIAGLLRTRLKLRPFSIEDLERLPEMEDETARAMIRVTNETLSAAYFADPNILALLIQKGLQLTVAHGNTPESAFCYSAFGMVMSGIVKRPDLGVPFGDLGVRVADRYGPAAMPSRVRYARDSLVAPVQVPLRQITPSLERSYQAGLETGDIGYATAALLYVSLHRLLSGAGLDEIAAELESTCDRLVLDAQDRNLVLALILRQFVTDLHTGPRPDGPFTGPHANGDEVLAAALASGDNLHVSFVLTFRAMSRWHHGDGPGARADLDRGQDYLEALLGQALLPVQHLYGVLAETGIGTDGQGSLRKARKHRRHLAWFAKHNPETHDAALLIADGALAARRNRFADAAELFHRAVDVATGRGFPHEVAVASRALAHLHEQAGRSATAGRQRGAVADAYRAWGSVHFGANARPGPAGGSATVGTSTATVADGFQGLDLATVVSASEAIGEQIELEELLARLLDVTLRNAGAEYGVLFRLEGDEVAVEASGTFANDRDDLQVSHGAEPSKPVAESVVRLVARTAEPVIAANAVDDPHVGTDPVVRERGIRSLLCLPLLNQGRLQGILYLENNQVDGAFTPERFRLLRILSSQAAAALEKARLLEAQGRFVPNQFLESLGHSNLLAAKPGQGILKDMDIVFTDIRGFTTIVEPMSPAQAMEFINDYLSHMEPVINQYGGFIDTYEGDAILALFEAGADAGIRAAVAMAKAEHEDNRLRTTAGKPPVNTGIGINTDHIMMGIVGGDTRMEASIVGDAANLASRVESLTKRYGTSLLASEYTIDRLLPTTRLDLRPLERVLVVGRVTPVRLYEVLDALDDELRERRLAALPRYLEALETFEHHRYEEAAKLFGELEAEAPDDVGVRVLSARANDLIGVTPEDDGPPVTQLDKK